MDSDNDFLPKNSGYHNLSYGFNSMCIEDKWTCHAHREREIINMDKEYV
jgi:hypothetical protein